LRSLFFSFDNRDRHCLPFAAIFQFHPSASP
jgi:hypothetical protein